MQLAAKAHPGSRFRTRFSSLNHQKLGKNAGNMNAQIPLPLNWPAPKFTFGQSVKARGYTGQIVGLEFQGSDHYLVRVENFEIGWAYTIQVDRSCPGYKIDPMVTVDESEVRALATALAPVA